MVHDDLVLGTGRIVTHEIRSNLSYWIPRTLICTCLD